MTVKSRIWWAVLTGTATRYRELPFLPDGRSGYSLILVWSINWPFVHQAEMKASLRGPRFWWFSRVHEKVMIYGARWKSHECRTRALSIPEVLPCLSDENKIVPTQIPSLYAFLTLAPSLDVHSAQCYLNFYAFYETPGCTWRLIHVDKCFVCLNQPWVLSQNLSKNLQSRHSNKKNVQIFGMLGSRLNFNPYRIFEYSPVI